VYFISGNAPSCHAPVLSIGTLESTSSPPPQKLLFSATLTQDPEKLQKLGLFQPKLFTSVVGDEQQGDGGEYKMLILVDRILYVYVYVFSLF
jgi:ATP-dependent RNA helicase DDX51/DBP6